MFLLLLTFSKTASAQDKILLLNGEEILAKPVEIKDTLPTLSIIELKKEKCKTLKKSDIFSITNANGVENVLYKEDTTSINNDLSVEGMRQYIKGLQEGKKSSAPLATVGGLVVGAGSSYLKFYGLIPPAIYIAVMGNYTPSLDKQPVSDRSLMKDENFAFGYIRKNKSKRTRNAALGSVIGFFAGTAAILLSK